MFAQISSACYRTSAPLGLMPKQEQPIFDIDQQNNSKQLQRIPYSSNNPPWGILELKKQFAILTSEKAPPLIHVYFQSTDAIMFFADVHVIFVIFYTGKSSSVDSANSVLTKLLNFWNFHLHKTDFS